MLRYCSLFSSSSGNCTYVGTSKAGILIDVGVSARRIELALHDREIDPATIRAVFVTHEHSDHIAGLQVLTRHYHWPVLASLGTLDALAAGDKIAPEQRLFVVEEGKEVSAADFQIQPFATPHDSRQCFGYRINAAGGGSIAVVTDIGFVTPTIRQTITGCDLVHIESNHDPVLLRNGPYPAYLKERIRGRGGHLSNEECSKELPALLQAGATRFVLAHLSGHNNTPELAVRTAREALCAAGADEGRDYLLEAAQPVSSRPVIYF